MAKFDQEKIITRLRDVVNHNNNPVITAFNPDTLDRLNAGFAYTFGHDRNYKPILVIRIDRINFQESFELVLNAYYYLMLTVYHYRMVPYHAEKITFIFDFGTLPLTSLPVFSLYDHLKKIGVCYCGITERTILVNAKSLGWVWKMISSFLTEAQKRKLVMVNEGE